MPSIMNVSKEVAAKRAKTLNTFSFIFRAVVPAIAAGVIFGVVKDTTVVVPAWLSWTPETWEPAILQISVWLRDLSFGAFVALFLLGMEAKNSVNKTLEEYKATKKMSFTKNNLKTYLFVGALLLVANVVAVKGMIFCFSAAGSSAVSFFFEKYANDYKSIALGVNINA